MEEPSLIYDWNEVTQDFQWSSIESVELDDETLRSKRVARSRNLPKCRRIDERARVGDSSVGQDTMGR